MKANKTNFWKSQSTKSKTTSKPETAKEGFTTARKSGGPRAGASRTEEYVSSVRQVFIADLNVFFVIEMRRTLRSSSSSE
jgi:hypothetical protein